MIEKINIDEKERKEKSRYATFYENKRVKKMKKKREGFKSEP